MGPTDAIEETVRLARLGAAVERKLGRRVQATEIMATSLKPPKRFSYDGSDDWVMCPRGAEGASEHVVCAERELVFETLADCAKWAVEDDVIPAERYDRALNNIKRAVYGLRPSAYGYHFGYIRHADAGLC